MAQSYEEMKEELVKAYQNLLEVQYWNKPKAKATVKLLIETLLADMLVWKIRDEWLNVDASVGVQLDWVGKWVGVDRYFKGNKFDNKKWYAYYDWNKDNQPNGLQGGMYDWNSIDKPDSVFFSYEWIVSVRNRINDTDFRVLIKLKIIKNNTVLTCKNIDDEIYKLFGDLIYTVWGESMELTYFYPVSYTSIMELAKDKEVLPVPCGVNLKLQEITNE